MLVLTRRLGEKIRIGSDVVITVTRIGQGSVRLGVEAPRAVEVARDELPPLGDDGRERRLPEGD